MTSTGETAVMGEKLAHCLFVYHKFHTDNSGTEIGPPYSEAANCLSGA